VNLIENGLPLSRIRPEGESRTFGERVPVLSRFYGITVHMHSRDHDPPHFHARYQDQEVLVEIDSGLVTGTFSRRALRLLFEWMELHREELERNWVRAREREPLQPIQPLP
jgi:hypothetical protein